MQTGSSTVRLSLAGLRAERQRRHSIIWWGGGGVKSFLCPFAVYYLRYAVRSFFTLSRISPADGKTAGQKVHRKIAAAVQKVKTPLLFVPLF
jgi:hypothetical protein